MQWASILSVAWMLWISGKGVVEGGKMPLEIKWYKMKGFARSIKQRRCIWQFAIVWGTAMERMSMCWRSCSVKTVSGICQMMMWGVQRFPRSLTVRQPAEYLLRAEANDKRSHLQWVGGCTVQLLSSQGSLVGGAQWVCNEDGSHFRNVNIANSEMWITSHKLSSSPLESHCQGPWTRKKHLAHRRL